MAEVTKELIHFIGIFEDTLYRQGFKDDAVVKEAVTFWLKM